MVRAVCWRKVKEYYRREVRSRRLLLSHLDKEQQKSLFRDGGFWVTSPSGYQYWIGGGDWSFIHVINKGEEPPWLLTKMQRQIHQYGYNVIRLGIYPLNAGFERLPYYENLLGQKLLVEAREMDIWSIACQSVRTSVPIHKLPKMSLSVRIAGLFIK